MNTCDICNKNFTHKSNLVVHMRVHSGEKPYSCDQCEKTFSQNGDLIRHKRIHTGEKPYPCDQCGKTFSYNSTLTVHKRVHTGEKPYPCDQCGKTFATIGHLTAHKRVHNGEKPYICDQCEKTFTTSTQLTAHKRIHTGEKPFSCDQCDKTFKTGSQMTEHKRIHTGEKPYSCDQCEKTFKTISSLTQHKRIHTGEKPYSCKLCDKQYSSSSALSAGHLKKLESTNNTVPALASASFIDCGEANVKLEIKKEETLDKDPLSIKIKADTSAFVACSEVPNEKSFSCEVCFKIFKSKEILSIHKYLHPEPKIKPEIKEEETLDMDPLSINMKGENIEETIKQEKGGEEIQDRNSLSCEHNSDEVIVNSIDIVEHKIEYD